MTAQTQFRELEDDPRLFLASPGDVAYLRRMAQSVVDSLSGHGGGAGGLALFAWETDLADTPLNDAVPIQEHIYRPDDPLCRGLVAFFGEKVGQPLAADFPHDMLADLLAANDGGPCRLVHPWRPEAAAEGGFPLTGSTFELLCAIAANRRRRAGQGDGGQELPVFLRFVGPPDVLEQEDPGRAAWGNRHLRNLIKEKFADDDEAELEHRIAIRMQLRCLRNFVLFLKQLGLEPVFEPDEDRIEQDFRAWLAANFLLVRDPLRVDPFRGLRSYDVDDYQVYFGRSEDQKTALGRIETIMAGDDRPNIYWIKGASGAGKSSFLRAGILGALRHSPRARADWAHAVQRPNELVSRAAASAAIDHCPLRVLLGRALDALVEAGGGRVAGAADPGAVLAAFDAQEAAARPGWAATRLDAILAEADSTARGGRPVRLAIGLDQFEEIVDMLDDPELGPTWQPLVGFVAEATRRRNLLVLATMREEREAKMAHHPALDVLWTASAGQNSLLSLPSATELESIIRKPFSEVGRAVLDDALVGRLVAAVLAYAKRHSFAHAGSVLPLVSLCLERIDEHVATPLVEARLSQRESDPAKALKAAVAEPAEERAASGPVVITATDARGYTELEGVIADLGRKAMEEARSQGAMEAQDSAVDGLLRQLVRWSGSDDRQFYLPTVPLPENAAERALARAMLKYRLLADEGGGQVRLVHETVLEHWPEGRDFCQRERPLHEGARALAVLADMWARPDPGPSIVDAGLENHAEAAFQILSLWSMRLHEVHCRAPAAEDLRLRDYCLALLDATCDAARVVEGTPQRSTHLHLASFYARHDTVRRMLERVPEAVDSLRKDGRTPVFAPCFLDDLALLELFLDAGADLEAADKDGWRPIHAAAVGGGVALTRRLVAAGADTGAGDAPAGTSPLHLAARNGHHDLVSYFIDEVGIDPDIRDRTGQTPLIHAIFEDRAETIRHLVEKGADVLAPLDLTEKSVGMTSIHVAARNGQVRSVEALLELGVPAGQATTNGAGPLHLAARNGFPACIRVLAGRLEDIDAKAMNLWTQKEIEQAATGRARDKLTAATRDKLDWTALHFAAAEGHPKAVAALVETGADPNARTLSGDRPLHLAIEAGKDAAAIRLSGTGADLEARNQKGQTALQQAVARQMRALAADLRRQGGALDAPVTGSGLTEQHRVTLLHAAAAEKDERRLRFLLGQKPDIDAATRLGRTALHIAAGAGLDRNLAHLLAAGATEIYRPDDAGLSPVDAACLAGSESCLDLMIARSDPDTLVRRCPDALHHAAQAGRGGLVRRLIALGYAAEARNSAGWTPLQIAAQEGRPRAARALLDHGARALRAVGGDPDRTAIDLALEAGATEVLELLLDSKETRAIDLEAMAVRALDLAQFDALGLLLERLGTAELWHPATGVALADLYRARLAGLARRFPLASFRSERLEAVLPAAAEPAPSSGTGRKAAKAAPADASPPQPGPPAGTSMVSHSRRNGLAGDLYPEYETGPDKTWSPLSAERLAGLVEELSHVDGRYRLSPDTLTGAERALPWYPGTSLIQLSDTALANPRLRLCYLAHEDRLYRLKGTSPPIHEMNAKVPIRLDESTVIDYLRFFCFFVRGDQGPFYICEDAADPLLPRHPETRRILEGTLRPIGFQGRRADGACICDAVVHYGNALFIANFSIQDSGNIEMLNDEPLATDLPVQIDAPLA